MYALFGLPHDAHKPELYMPIINVTDPQTQERRPPLTLRTFDEILAMSFDDSDNILGDRQLSKGGNSCIVGPSGAGKTRLIMQLAISGIIGSDFLGLPINGRSLKWLFLQVENSNRRLQTDLQYFKRWVSPEKWPAVQAQCVVHTLENDSDGMVFLDNMDNQTHISNAVQQAQPDVVVWDSLQNFAIGDLNKDYDMFKTLYTVSTLTKKGNNLRLPLVIHHALTGKTGAVKALGIERAGYARNSKSIHAWARGQINVAVASPNSYETVILSCGKCSDGKEFEPFAAHFNEQTHIYSRDDTFDIKGWINAIQSSSKPKVEICDVLNALNGNAMTKNELFEAIEAEVDASKSAIYRAIDRAERAKKVKYDLRTMTYRKP